jgi:hypothetical protein
MLISERRAVVKSKEVDRIIMGTKGATGALKVLFETHTMQVANGL